MAQDNPKLRGKLPKGEGRLIGDAFQKLVKNVPEFKHAPQAVCFTVDELRAFLDAAEQTVNPDPAKPVPANEIGVAIIPGYRNNKITFMLVATRFREDKPNQQVLAINNPVTGIHMEPAAPTLGAEPPLPPDPEPPVGDTTYDTGSTYP
ncbi:hypothetical protein [Sediminibacterium soli]|uniref:hypothetical protein n=1 Tax=Sediminibacterium soli TaxID=2698829 RepID=UPI00137969CA|nr:hypothetical protein [Sediminibacterium soli]NCI47819.1 hypothetical protein [Sediminibacterium soli]